MAKINRAEGEDPTADWADMRIFLAVLDNGSLGAAAESLNLSQPTVGRRLSALESRLGANLFARTGRRMLPTEVALTIEESARRMAHEMYAIERSVSGAAEGLCGLVTISATEGTGSEWLVRQLQPLRERYPDISIRLVIEARNADLVSREADIALRMSRPTQLDLIVRRLTEVGFGLYASKDYLKQVGGITDVADLNRVDWVVSEIHGRDLAFAAGVFAELGVERRSVLATNSLAAQLSGVRAGLGVGVLSHLWATLSGGLIPVLPNLDVLELELYLVSHEDLRHSARIRAVADHIAEAARRDTEQFRSGLTSVA